MPKNNRLVQTTFVIIQEKDAEKAEMLPVEEEPKVVERAKSPDQYEKLKLNFLSKQKEALEKELKLLEQQVKFDILRPLSDCSFNFLEFVV